MRYRRLGKTGIQVSAVGYGASPLGNEFGPADVEEGTRAVHCAIDHGINFFDVSPYYGRTLAEERLGQALQGKRDRVVLATKVGRYGADLETGFDFSAQRVKRSIDESLGRLRTDSVDLLQAHDIEFGDKQQILHETLPALEEIRQAGKTRFIGVTGYPLRLLREVAETSCVDTILTYCRYNLLDTAMDQVLAPLVDSLRVGLINASPLHMRMLTEKGPPDWHPAPKRVGEYARRAAEACRARGVDIAELAMQFAVARPKVSTTLVGMSKVRHVEQNIRMVSKTPDPALLAEVQAILSPVANVCWKSGRAENDDAEAEDKQS